MIASMGAARRSKFDRRAVLKALFGVPLSSLPATTSMRSADAQAALQPIRMGIQIFTGAVATVWFEKKFTRSGASSSKPGNSPTGVPCATPWWPTS